MVGPKNYWMKKSQSGHLCSLPAICRFRVGISLLVLFSILMILLGCGSTGIVWPQTYRGRVVDANTVEPLEGAVVAIVWYKRPFITMNGPAYFHSATEGFTDPNGEFAVNGSPGIILNPFTSIEERPYIAIFKPGYGPFPVAHLRERPLDEMREAMLKEGVVVKLPKLQTQQEMRSYGGPANMRIPPDVPYEEIPNLIRLINIHRKLAGLTSSIGKPTQ